MTSPFRIPFSGNSCTHILEKNVRDAKNSILFYKKTSNSNPKNNKRKNTESHLNRIAFEDSI